MEGNRLDELKELKVSIPTELHLQLMRTKYLRGKTIGATVREALALYFARLEGDGDRAP